MVLAKRSRKEYSSSRSMALPVAVSRPEIFSLFITSMDNNSKAIWILVMTCLFRKSRICGSNSMNPAGGMFTLVSTSVVKRFGVCTWYTDIGPNIRLLPEPPQLEQAMATFSSKPNASSICPEPLHLSHSSTYSHFCKKAWLNLDICKVLKSHTAWSKAGMAGV